MQAHQRSMAALIKLSIYSPTATHFPQDAANNTIGLSQKHRIAIAEESVRLINSMAVDAHDRRVTGKC